MKRNRNIDIVRAIATILVVLYHIYAITGISVNNSVLEPFLIYGGIIGVSLFFVLSGFGIYNSLKNQENKKEKFNYHEYLKKRFKRIAPQYYISLIVLLLFTSSAIYISKDQILNLFSHAFFFHNLFYTMAGAISGVCWTLGVTFQFYLVAPFLYKIVEKKPKLTLTLSFFISIVLKYIIYHFILSPTGIDNVFLYSNYGNQLFTAIEFFVLGMLLAKVLSKPKVKKSNNVLNAVLSISCVVGLYYVLRLASVNNIPFLENTGIYSDCQMGYVWHNILAVFLGLFIYFFSKIKISYNNILSKGLLFVSKYEYGIFIWHLVMIEALNNNSPFIQSLVTSHPLLVYLILFSLSIFVGYVMTKIIDNIDYKELFLPIKNNLNIIIKILISCLIIFLVYKSVLLIKPTLENISNYYGNHIKDENQSKKIANNASKIIDTNSSCKYIYIDVEETGYLYFYQLRYYLSPCESVHYNTYAYVINYGTVHEIYDYLKNIDVDYFIIKDNPILEEELEVEFDEVNGSIFKKNDNSTSIDDLFIEDVS